MNVWKQWLRRPQNIWLRRAFFQIHLWIGVALGLYVLVISLSGSAIVFRNEIYGAFDKGPRIVEVKGAPLSDEQLKEAAVKLYPDQSVSFIWKGKRADYATEIWMDNHGARNQRLFNQYTGEDLGPSVPYAIQTASWFMQLHTDLLGGKTGRLVNGAASALLCLLCISGLVVWWPGINTWKRALWVNPKSGWKRINWDLHSAFGFWTFALLFMWCATGVFLVWPLPVQKMVNHFSPLIQYALPEEVPDAQYPPALSASGVLAQTPIGGGDQRIGGNIDDVPSPPKGGFGKGRPRPQIRRSNGDIFLRWLYYLHFGNFAGGKTKALWVVLGLLPILLFVTGTIMWWNRVLSPAARRLKRAGQTPTAV
jgi:uncharacterized iron-regulated membrane protein